MLMSLLDLEGEREREMEKVQLEEGELEQALQPELNL